MASTNLVDASVVIPIFNSRGWLLKTTLIRRVGGQAETDGNDVATVKAMRRLNLSIRPGDRLGLIGHNGAGKSTPTKHPDILLFDEMTSFGDAGFAARAKARLDPMLDRAKILVLASHDIDSLRTYCNRAVLFEAGKIVGEGSVEEVWQCYIDGVEEASAATIAEVYEGETDAGGQRMRDVSSADAAG